MMLTTYSPWHTMRLLNNEMNRAFPQGPVDTAKSAAANVTWIPAVDIKENGNEFLITADIPGVDPEKIEITADSGYLSIKGERAFEASNEDESGSERYRRVERVHGSFMRRFALPDTADADAITARGTNGVLKVHIPKRASLQPKRIAVAA
ncbi:Hsp20/alpha crystallin family protein [Thioalkalivibrio sp. HK1]|uniref:Hsp20/alpha crystallin family protein n=1 Tax=Thioalkalivibrio sp. HK1 TaxID=1469245 RepID=UPI0004702636|nr:Hsp20/alpha crystallin family protein [Thioalkalivibrio sp. HK1]